MNEISEMWSLPWHELQHSLANGLAAQAAPLVAGIIMARKAQVSSLSAPSWLARARAQVQQVAGRGL
ncbi:MAG: hypothetical protein ABSF94_02405 [Steroidobacteraceae bacterium]|jgi:hypothetical protein